MRNIMKPAATASSRTRRSVRGVAAVVASLALAAGLGSYPVDAQEPVASATDSAVAEAASESATTPSVAPAETVASETSPERDVFDRLFGPATAADAPASAETSGTPAKPAFGPNAVAKSPVTWTRDDNVDHIVVEDPEGEAWEFGGKASDENVFALKRIGKGEIEEVLSVTADERELEPYDFGFFNTPEGSFVAFNLNALHTIPPQVVDIKVRTTDAGEYAIAESDEVPTVAELEASGYGAATPPPASDLNFRASDELFWSAEQRLDAPIVGAGTQSFEGLTGNKQYIEVKPKGSFPGQANPDIRITRIVLKNIQNNNLKPDLEWAVDKNGNEKYFGKGAFVKDTSGREKGVEIRFFDPETGESPIPASFLIWSGSDSLKIASKLIPAWVANTTTLKDRYEVEVYGSFRVKDERKKHEWSEGNSDGSLTAVAKPKVSIQENDWNFEMKQTLKEGGILTPTITAKIPKGDTSYGISGDSQPRMIVAGPDGSTMTEIPGRVIGDTAHFELPNLMAIPDGASITVRMELTGDNSRRQEVPNGPGTLAYRIEPNDNEAVPGPGGKFTEPKRLEGPEGIETGGKIQFETVTTSPAGRAYFKVDGGPVTLESITLKNKSQQIDKDPSGAGFEILANECRTVPSSQLTSCQRYVWLDGDKVKVIENADGSMTYKFDHPYTLEEGQRFALPFANGKLESTWSIQGSTPQVNGQPQQQEADYEGKNPIEKLPDPEQSTFSIPSSGGKAGRCLTTNHRPNGLDVKENDHPTLVQFAVDNSSDYRNGSIHVKRNDGKVFETHNLVYEFTDSQNRVEGTNGLRSQVVRGWGTDEIIIDLAEIAKVYESNGWSWPANRKFLNLWLNTNLQCKDIETAIYKTQTGAEPSNKGQRVCDAKTVQPERRRGPNVAARPGGVYVVASDLSKLPAGAGGSPDYRYSSQLYLQDSGDGRFEAIGPSTPWVYNALSYNPQDNWLYAISQPRGHDTTRKLTYLEDPCYPAGHLLQIDPHTGEVFDLGKVTKPASGPTHSTNTDYGFQGAYRHTPTPATSANDLWGGLNTGVFDNENRYWVANASRTGTKSLYLVDLDAQSAQMLGNPATGEFETRSEDLAALPEAVYPDAKPYLWGLRSPSGDSGKKILLERIDVRDGKVKTIDVTNLVDPVTGFKLSQINGGNPPIWGKAWTYGNGDLGFGTGGASHSTDSVRLRVINPGTDKERVELISHGQAPRSYNTDGASTLASRNVDLSINKTRSEVWTDGKQTKLNWTIRVTNESYGPSSGFEVKDFLPDQVENPAVTAVVGSNSTWSVQWGPGNEKKLMRFVHGYLAPRSSIEIHLSADVKESDKEAVCAPNYATLTPNDIDHNLDNNSDVDSPCVEKVAGETNGPDGNGVYTAKYVVKITNPLQKEETIGGVKRPAVALNYGTVIDTPRFPQGIQVVGAKWTGTNENEESLGGGQASKEDLESDLKLKLSDGGTINAGQKRNFHQYEVEIHYRVTDYQALNAAVDPNTCLPGKTLFNHVSVDGAEDIACLPPPKEERVFLHLAKVSLDALQSDDVLANGQLLEGALFEIAGLDEEGNLVAGRDPMALTYNKDRGTFDSSGLTPGKYRLREVKAPAGYSLLVKPIDFVVSVQNGVATITPDDAASVVSKWVEQAPKEWNLSSLDAVLAVANVRQGDLPKTGGAGLQLPILLGGALIAAGALVGRRKVAA